MTRILMIVQNDGYLMVSFFYFVFCHGKDNRCVSHRKRLCPFTMIKHCGMEHEHVFFFYDKPGICCFMLYVKS